MLGLCCGGLRGAKKAARRRVCAALRLWRAARAAAGAMAAAAALVGRGQGPLAAFLSVASGNKDTRVCVGLTADAG